MNPTHQIWTLSKMMRLPPGILERINFYAPLIHHLDYYGIGEATFERPTTELPVWRDGGAHLVAVDVPPFEYIVGLPYGIHIVPGTNLTYPQGNRLSSGTLIWFQEDVVKVAPLNAINPFSAGMWVGEPDAHVKDVIHVEGVITVDEIAKIIEIIADTPQSPFAINGWLYDSPAYITSTQRLLASVPDTTTLLLSIGGMLIRRVASAPTFMQFTSDGTSITLGIAQPAELNIRALYRRTGQPSGGTFLTEDLAGTKNGSNKAFTITTAPDTDSVIIVVRSGFALHKVPPAAALMEYELSGTNVTLGEAPESTEDLWAMIQTDGDGFAVEDLQNTKDGANKVFTITTTALENTIMLFRQGLAAVRVLSSPAATEYTLDGSTIVMGEAPAAGDALWAFYRKGTPVPLTIAGNVLALESDSIVGLVDDDPVTTWPDTGLGEHDGTAAGTARPLYKTGVLNGRPILRFDGVNDTMTLGNVTQLNFGLNPFTLVIVVDATTPANKPVFVKSDYLGADNGLYFLMSSSGGGQVSWYDGSVEIGFGTVGPFQVLTLIRRGTGVGETEAYRNGVLQATGTDTRDIDNTKAVTIGNSADGGQAAAVDVAAIYAYTGTPILTDLYTYLSAKYTIAIP